LVICSTVKPRYSAAIADWAPWATTATSAMMASLSCLVNKSHLLSMEPHNDGRVLRSALIECTLSGTSPTATVARKSCLGLHRLRRPAATSHYVSTPAVFDGCRLTPTAQSHCYLETAPPKAAPKTYACWVKLAVSTGMPGPMVLDSVIFLTYTPLAVDGLAFIRPAISACRFSRKAGTSKVTLPMAQWTIPLLSAR